jgi:CrcB-like protein, Camphor Resistance (CrcB)
MKSALENQPCCFLWWSSRLVMLLYFRNILSFIYFTGKYSRLISSWNRYSILNPKQNKRLDKKGVGTGFCGGFTTMSTFSKEAFELLAGGNLLKGIFYIIPSLVGGILFCSFGFLIGTKRNKG